VYNILIAGPEGDSMRRKLQLMLLLLLIAGTTETGMRASTDCERWMAAYKVQLAHAKAMKRMQAAHARVKHLAQKKLANYVKKPAAPKPAHFVKPRYTRQQMLDRFNIACGDLPDGSKPADQLVEGKKTPAEFLAEMEPYEPMGLIAPEDGGLIPSGDLPPYTPPGGDGGGPPGGVAGPPIFGGGGGGGNGGGGGGGGQTPTPPITTVPEPGSLVMMLTGIAGAAGAIRRRVRG
jgi:hypothetical protein